MILRRIASLRLTVPLMLGLAAAVLVSYRSETASVWWLTAPLLALAVNLFSAIATDTRFRRQAHLLAFHVCLLLLLCLAAVSQLTSLRGRVEIAVGQAFEPGLVNIQSKGPWHSATPFQAVSFVQGPINVAYEPRMVRGRTRSTVFTPNSSSGTAPLIFGDNIPLNSGGYRFYTTSNKGYAVILTWRGSDGGVITGAVHMPSYPRLDWQQIKNWTTPTGAEIELELELPRPTPIDESWVLDSRRAAGSLLLKSKSGSVKRLAAGESWSVSGGTVRFDEVRMWMGYEVQAVPLLPWMFATALIGVLALGWHFWRRFGVRTAQSSAPQDPSTKRGFVRA
jgi:cytochrome c biogenesis protein